MVEDDIFWTKLGHLGIGLWRRFQRFDLSYLDVLDADIYVQNLEKKKWQIFQQTELVQNQLLGMLGLTCFVHLWSNNTDRKWNNTKSNSPMAKVIDVYKSNDGHL